jgi:mannose-6-phosphate isomerase-like protein (cupin superfamily)
LFPTLPTLLRIALVFGVGLEYFLSGNREKPVVGIVRRQERLRFPDKPGAREVAYAFESLDYAAVERRLNSYLVEFFPVAPERLRLHQHSGGEFIYVLGGTLCIRIGDEEHTLRTHDSIYFDPATPHAYRRAGTRKCTAIVVTTP